MAKKIAFVQNKGGSLKTTSTVNLAGAYCKQYPDKKVLIVECDGQGNSTASFGLKANSYDKTMYDVFMGTKKPEDCIVNAWGDMIHIIPANADMNYVEFDMMQDFDEATRQNTFNIIQEFKGYDLSDMDYDGFSGLIKKSMTDNYFNRLAGKFDVLDDMYDVIIFDTPPEIKSVTASVLAIIDEVIIPFEPDTYSSDGISNILHRIAEIKELYNEKLHIAGILAVKVKSNTKVHISIINTVIKYCNRNGIYYFQSEIPNSIRFATATSVNGLPATIVQKDNPFVRSYYELLEELFEIKVL